jgi:hypothetical protein
MRRIFAATIALAIVPASSGAEQRPILYDAVALNIGVTCQWQSPCIKWQRTAMRHALSYVATRRPPEWRVHLCNRNASRGGVRVDWIGFDHCIRNASLKAPPSRARKHSRR